MEDTPTYPAGRVFLEVRHGHGVGTRMELERFPLVIGRGSDADVRLPDAADRPTLSRRHARLNLVGGVLVVEDLSTNGTRVGERLLSRGEPFPLQYGQMLMLGTSIGVTIEKVDQPSPGENPYAEGQVNAGPRLEIRFLGPPTVRVDGREIPGSAWQTRKAFALFAFLVDHHPRAVAATRLVDTLWEDQSDDPRQVLHASVSRVRRALRSAQATGPDLIRHDHGLYSLSGVSALHYDVQRFEAAVDRGMGTDSLLDLEEATSLFGEFLEGSAEDWVQARRHHLTVRWHEATDRLAALYERAGAVPQARTVLQRVIARDPCHEPAWLALMRSSMAEGRRDEAVRQYEGCAAALRRHLDIAPGPELTTLLRRIQEK